MKDFQEIIIPIFGMLSVFGTTFVIILLAIRAHHKERMLMIEKIEQGVDMSLLASARRPKSKYWYVKYGMLMIGVAIGMFFGHILAQALFQGNYSASYFSMILVFGGASLIIYFFIDKKYIHNKTDGEGEES